MSETIWAKSPKVVLKPSEPTSGAAGALTLDRELLEWIVAASATGMSYAEIAAFLHDRDEPTIDGQKTWTTATVSAILAASGR